MPAKGSKKSSKTSPKRTKAKQKQAAGKLVQDQLIKPKHQPQRRTKKIKKVVQKTRKPWSKAQITVWALVGMLLVANVLALALPTTLPSGHSTSLDEDLEGFERLSYWQNLLFGNIAALNDVEHRSSFDGLPLDPNYEESVISVMIDNFSLARPQHSGIRSASLVYEFLVEGGITRLMALYPYQELDRVGPVRSSRDYSVHYAEENGGLHVHMGGSPDALEQLETSDRVYHLEEDIREQGQTYSFRDERYSAPHDLFFDLLEVREYAEDQDWELEKAQTQWCFNTAEASERSGDDDESEESEELDSLEAVEKLAIDFSHDPNSSYYVQFQYFPEQQVYKRYYYDGVGVPHTDQHDLLQVAPSNVIVQIASSALINGDEQERLQMNHIGSGTAMYYQDGLKQVGSWEKADNQSPTQFFDADGEPICMNPGQTWIAIVDDEGLVQEQ